jgi:hypothetical protein
MKLSTLLSIYAVVAVVFCTGLLLLPAFWITLYGARADAQATVLLRLVGALFGGPAVMAWVGRNAEPSKSRDAMVLGLIVLNGLAAIVALSGALSGVYNQFAWGPVATFALCATSFLLVGRAGRPVTAPN